MEGKDLPFRLASDKIKRNHNIEISHDTIRRATEKIGFDQFNQQKQELTGEEVLACEELPFSDTICLEIDGSTINTTEHGWKEYKLGIVFKGNDVVNDAETSRTSIAHKKLVGGSCSRL